MRRKPDWFKIRIGGDRGAARVRGILEAGRLRTVCGSAECPNRAECFSEGVATFLVLGDVCTRGCAFCSVKAGTPGPVEADEPERLADAAARLGLAHVVITSVTRDDLPDGGAAHFAACVRAVKAALPAATAETLVPDFRGDLAAVDTVLDSGIDVFNHNVETVPRLYPAVRRGADYARSLKVLARAAERGRGGAPLVKSGLMVGLGETDGELDALLADLYAAGVRAVTAGQYLQPRRRNVEVAEYWTPERFVALEARARAIGFPFVKAAPLVRSSYRAIDFRTR